MPFHHESTHVPVHEARAVQGLTDGHTVVVGHPSEQEHLSATKEVDKEKLCYAAPQRNGFPFSQQI